MKTNTIHNKAIGGLINKTVRKIMVFNLGSSFLFNLNTVGANQ